MIFRFASPWFLLLLIPLIGLGIFKMKGQMVSRDSSVGLGVPSLKGLSSLPKTPFLMLRPFIPWIKILAIALMVVALARPQSGRQKTEITTRGVNIVLALDLSESMRALDFKLDGEMVDRLQAVKSVVGDFILNRDGDRMGMVVFGSHAFTQLPLTRDYNTITFMLDHLRIGAAGPKTAIGDALGISLKRLEDIPSDSNIIILLTDGESNAGALDWEEAADIAAHRGVKIYTVGVGSNGEAPFLTNGLFGQHYAYRRVSMDENALKTIAQKTGGIFFKAEDTQGLMSIYERIDALEKTEVTQEKWVEYKENYPLFLVLGLILMGTHLFLGGSRFMEVPR